MEHIRIGSTDVVLQDFGDGKGKIIISDDEYGYDFSYYWGAMGKDTTLVNFIQSLNSDYFVKKLSHNIKGPLNIRGTFSELRRHIQECFQYELKWYEHMAFQKDFRKKLKQLQKEVSCADEFVFKLESFCDELDFYLIEDRHERERLENLFKNIFSNSEPWYFIEHETHIEEIFLEKFHSKLKEKLSKPVQLCLF